MPKASSQCTDRDRGLDEPRIRSQVSPDEARALVDYKVPKALGLVGEGAGLTDDALGTAMDVAAVGGELVLKPMAAALMALSNVIPFAEWLVNLRYRDNVPYGSGVATALTLDAMGISPWKAQVPEYYRNTSANVKRLPGRFGERGPDPAADFKQGVADVVMALEKKALKRTATPWQFYMQCFSAVVTPPRAYTKETLRAHLARDWESVEGSLRRQVRRR